MTLSATPRISCEVIDTRADRARIFNFQCYSLDDGRGTRTVVFLKGYPRTYPWCANSESISPRIQTLRRESKCPRCTRCQQDVAECPSGAWEQTGRDVTLDNLLQEVLKDEVFFRASSGGVTLSGDEVLIQAGFAVRFPQRLHQWGTRTVIETAGDGAFDRFLPVAEACNEALFGLRIMEPERARSLLRVNQPRVLDSFRQLAARRINLIPRVPLIPGYTLNTDSFRQILAFLAPFALKEMHLLSFHQYGEPKYRLLDRPWTLASVKAPDEAETQPYRVMAEAAGFHITIDG